MKIPLNFNLMQESTINDDLLCTLVHIDNGVDIEYIRYENSLESELQGLVLLCEDESSCFDDIVKYILSTNSFGELTGEFKYCVSLDGTYQGFILKSDSMLREIETWEKVIDFNERHSAQYNKDEDIKKYKNQIKNDYTNWCNSLAINKAYRLCHNDKNVLAFSHRICGWSNPVYQLTANFSVEVKTNFGYGRSSYFYTKLAFKGLEITPFSHWAQYEIASLFRVSA